MTAYSEKKTRLYQTLVRHSDVQKQNMDINAIRQTITVYFRKKNLM